MKVDVGVSEMGKSPGCHHQVSSFKFIVQKTSQKGT
jgi:hypothetical protein